MNAGFTKTFLLLVLLILSGISCGRKAEACIPTEPDSKLRSASVLYAKTRGESDIYFCLDLTPVQCFNVNIESGKYTSSENSGDKNFEQENYPDAAERKVNSGQTMVLYNNFSEGKSEISVRSLPEEKPVSTISFPRDDSIYISGDFLGDSILVSSANCAGPCTKGSLYNPETGKLIGMIGGSEFNIDGTTPVQIGGSIYAFNSGYGEELIFQNIKTGEITGRIDLKEVIPKSEEGSLQNNPMMNRMLKLSSSRLALVYSTTNAGDIAVIDISGKKLVNHIIPSLCNQPREH